MGVLVICVLVFTVLCIVCTVFLNSFVYVYLFLFVLSVLVYGLRPPNENSIAAAAAAAAVVVVVVVVVVIRHPYSPTWLRDVYRDNFSFYPNASSSPFRAQFSPTPIIKPQNKP